MTKTTSQKLKERKYLACFRKEAGKLGVGGGAASRSYSLEKKDKKSSVKGRKNTRTSFCGRTWSG